MFDRFGKCFRIRHKPAEWTLDRTHGLKLVHSWQAKSKREWGDRNGIESGLVSRVLYQPREGLVTIIYLCTPIARRLNCNLPERQRYEQHRAEKTANRSPISRSALFGLAPDGVYQADRVTSTAGALLPHRFTLTTHVWRFAFCCTFPSLAAGRRYRPSCPAEPGLSSSEPNQSSPPAIVPPTLNSKSQPSWPRPKHLDRRTNPKVHLDSQQPKRNPPERSRKLDKVHENRIFRKAFVSTHLTFHLPAREVEAKKATSQSKHAGEARRERFPWHVGLVKSRSGPPYAAVFRNDDKRSARDGLCSLATAFASI